MFGFLRTFAPVVFTILGLHTVHSAITDCGAGKSLLQLTDLAFTPSNPSPGLNTEMVVKFNNPGPDITDGTVTTSISWNYIPIEPTIEALCSNTKCPLLSGMNDRSTSSSWPDVTGYIQSHIEWKDTFDNLLLCIDMDVTTAYMNTTKSLRGSQNKEAVPFGLVSYFHRWDYSTILDDVCYEVNGVEEAPPNAEEFYKTPNQKQLTVWTNYSNALNLKVF